MCPGPGSNQRHADFQSAALPTELPGQTKVFGFQWVSREETNDKAFDVICL